MASLFPQERKKTTLKQYKSVTSKLLWLLFFSISECFRRRGSTWILILGWWSPGAGWAGARQRLMQSSWWGGGAPAELHAGSDVLRTLRLGRTGLASLQARLSANWNIAAVQTEPQSRLIWIFPEPTWKCSRHTWRLMWRRVPKATISWNAIHPMGELLNLLHPVCSPRSPVKAQLQRTGLE